MGESMWVTVRFGGPITAKRLVKLAEELDSINVMEEDDLREAITSGTFAEWEGEANYGDVGDLTGILDEFGLTWVKTCDPKYEYGGDITRCVDGGAEEICGYDGNEPVIGLKDLQKAVIGGKSLPDLIADLQRISAPPPPLSLKVAKPRSKRSGAHAAAAEG